MGVYQGRLAAGARAVETFSFDTPPPVDIVVAVDQSDSMTDDAVLLGAGFDAFATALSARSTGWQLGVVTLDSGCFNGGILSASSANLADVFADAVSLGEDATVSDDEALLLLSERAVSLDAPGQCNEGLRRPNAPLHVIVVSDEPERSGEQASAFTWSFWVDELQSYVSRPDRLVVHGVIDIDDCNEGADGYEQAIDATGGVAESICATHWPDALASLANGITQGLYRLPLTGTPAPGSIEVTVGGVGVSAHYDANTSELVLDEPVAPGVLVEVSYTPLVDCSP
jgi:hypothetical protein